MSNLAGHSLQSDPTVLSKVLCPSCSGGFDLSQERCAKCGRVVRYENGILSLLKEEALKGESIRERQLRDQQALAEPPPTVAELAADPHMAMEVEPTIEWLGLKDNDSILELGCGAGRYTQLITGPRRSILAMDFSVEAIRRLQVLLTQNKATENVAYVHASIGDFATQPASFDVAFSTLTSNLPDYEHRQKLYQTAAQSLKSTGRFVFSAHHHALRYRFTGVPKSGHYKDGGIYRYHLETQELRRELSPWFGSIRMSPMQIYVPYFSRKRETRVRVSRVAEKIPFIRSLGGLLICEAKDPRPAARAS